MSTCLVKNVDIQFFLVKNYLNKCPNLHQTGCTILMFVLFYLTLNSSLVKAVLEFKVKNACSIPDNCFRDIFDEIKVLHVREVKAHLRSNKKQHFPCNFVALLLKRELVIMKG